MSDVFEDIINKLTELPEVMPDFVGEAAEGQYELMVKLNIDQLDAGLNSDGTAISPPYTRFTVAQKIRKGQVFDRVTLEDTGAYKRDKKVESYNRKLEIVSTNKKGGLPTDEILVDKYGENINGLTVDHIEEVAEAMLPKELELVKKYLFE